MIAVAPPMSSTDNVAFYRPEAQAGPVIVAAIEKMSSLDTFVIRWVTEEEIRRIDSYGESPHVQVRWWVSQTHPCVPFRHWSEKSRLVRSFGRICEMLSCLPLHQLSAV